MFFHVRCLCIELEKTTEVYFKINYNIFMGQEGRGEREVFDYFLEIFLKFFSYTPQQQLCNLQDETLFSVRGWNTLVIPKL